jgi:hypothetical protein
MSDACGTTKVPYAPLSLTKRLKSCLSECCLVILRPIAIPQRGKIRVKLSQLFDRNPPRWYSIEQKRGAKLIGAQ